MCVAIFCYIFFCVVLMLVAAILSLFINEITLAMRTIIINNIGIILLQQRIVEMMIFIFVFRMI